MGKIKT